MEQINSFILSAILLLCASCGGKQTETTATTEPDGNALGSTFAGTGCQRQFTFPLCQEEQCAACRSAARLAEGKGIGLTNIE